MTRDIWNCGGGNYVVAGSDCFVSLLGNFIDNHNGSEYFNDDKINNFLKNSIDRYLYSFGTGLSYKTKKMSPKHVEKIVGEIKAELNKQDKMKQKIEEERNTIDKIIEEAIK